MVSVLRKLAFACPKLDEAENFLGKSNLRAESPNGGSMSRMSKEIS